MKLYGSRTVRLVLLAGLILQSSSLPSVARAAEPADFAAASQWRADFGLDASPARVRAVLAAQKVSKFGRWVTATEARQLEERAVLTEALGPALKFIEDHPGRFGPPYFDTSSGSLVLVVVVTPETTPSDQARIAELAPKQASVIFRQAPRTREALDRITADAVMRAARANTGATVAHTFLDARSNSVVVTLDAPGGLTPQTVQEIDGARPDEIDVRVAPKTELMACDTRLVCPDLRGGIIIAGPGEEPDSKFFCTAGFMGRPAEDPLAPVASSIKYLLTAGHCFGPDAQGIHQGPFEEGDYTGPTIGNVTRRYNPHGGALGVPAEDVGRADALRIELEDPASTGLNLVFGDGDHPGIEVHSLGATDQPDEWPDWTEVCMSGVTTNGETGASSCGHIRESGAKEWDLSVLPFPPNVIWTGTGTDIVADHGDSGGAVYSASGVAYGIVHTGTLFIHWMQFQPIHEALADMDMRLCLDSICGPYAGFDAPVYIGTSEVFHVTSTAVGATSVTYDWGDGSSNSSTSHTYSTPNVYRVTQHVTSAYDTDSVSRLVNVTSGYVRHDRFPSSVSNTSQTKTFKIYAPANGQDVYITDPDLCRTSSASLGDTSDYLSLTTSYTLKNSSNTTVGSSGSLFNNENNLADAADLDNGWLGPDCTPGVVTNPNVGAYWHARNWPLATDLPAGTYTLTVSAVTSGNYANRFTVLAPGGYVGSTSAPADHEVRFRKYTASRAPTVVVGSSGWTNPANALVNDSLFASSGTSGSGWITLGDFGNFAVTGTDVQPAGVMMNVRAKSNSSLGGCVLKTTISQDDGTTYGPTPVNTDNITTAEASQSQRVPGSAVSTFGLSPLTLAGMADGSLAIKLTRSCPSGKTLELNSVTTKFKYAYSVADPTP